MTRIGETHAPDDVYQELQGQFQETEIVALTFAVVAINCWNRLMIGFRVPAGTYQPQAVAASEAR